MVEWNSGMVEWNSGMVEWNIPYSGNLSREKTFANWRKRGFRGENFRTGHTARYMHAWVWSQLIATPTVVRGGGVH